MIDSHCHLNFGVFDQDREQVLAEARDAGITGFLVPGTELKGFANIQRFALAQPDVYYALGYHPYFLNNRCDYSQRTFRDTLVEHLESLSASKLLAVGEIGLDYHIQIDHELQRNVFQMQLAIANEFGLPVILHHRKSHNDLIKLLKDTKFTQGGVLHAFSGSAYEAQSYVDLGLKLGVGGTITYDRAHKTKQALKTVGVGALLLETDSPDMPLKGFQGMRNEPSKVINVATELSNLLEHSVDEIEKQTNCNFVDVFKVQPFCS